ncbi:ribosomal protection-like ABC-F family protein [Anaerocolumna sp. MB42-C2]|uniref:ribosomal protection-like ABC-F family protein n=1 Tax=Anaerocolumna sp. MB42-C2 TaxID=3070997 RepID=UPI0027DF0D5B|nr:ATP-binding cassette domain-containing protein [Anaerocolumna sp. MB42-C2]WMJ88225.1 ATP-binding cassette domain-containing protein [Anaerocolumna sp. MB42-C2]
MSKIIINEMSYHYTNYYNPIFHNVNIILDTNWRLGLIGRNGRGKTTFLKLLLGELKPDKGNIIKKVDMLYFPFINKVSYCKTIDVIKENIGFLKSMEDKMESILAEDMESRLEEYQTVFENYLQSGGFEMESRIKRELNLMHLSEKLLERDFDSLSGGEKTKMLIISLFLRKNGYILLDEPTNHLDVEGKRTLSDYLKHKTGFLIVSHDRQFLDMVTDHIMAINKADITLEKGNYSSWKSNKDKTEVFELRTKTRLEREITSLENRSVQNRNWAAIAEKEKNPYASNNRGNGSRAAKFMRQAKASELAIRKNIEYKKELLKNYEITQDLNLEQQSSEIITLISIKNLSFKYTKEYVLKNISLKINKGDRIWVRGKNGSGKSTLLKILGQCIDAENITFQEHLIITQILQEPGWTTGYINDYFMDCFRLQKFKTLCEYLDIDEETLKRPIETFSSGEVKKIETARALALDNQLILMDEPLNYMDIYFREQLEKAIITYQPTIVFVEHDERFGYNVANKIIDL